MSTLPIPPLNPLEKRKSLVEQWTGNYWNDDYSHTLTHIPRICFKFLEPRTIHEFVKAYYGVEMSHDVVKSQILFQGKDKTQVMHAASQIITFTRCVYGEYKSKHKKQVCCF